MCNCSGLRLPSNAASVCHQHYNLKRLVQSEFRLSNSILVVKISSFQSQHILKCFRVSRMICKVLQMRKLNNICIVF